MDEPFCLGEDGIYRCRAFAQFEWQTHGFGTRHANPKTDVTLRQIHSDKVWNAHGLQDREQEGDALVTDDSGLSVGVRTADCVPILLLDAKRQAVGAVHAGWRGSAAEIVNAAVQKMIVDFGSEAADIRAAIGPCIRECCYEVGSDVAGHFTRWTSPREKPDGKWNLNLAQVNVCQLQRAGIASTRIFDSHLCTYCRRETFYSFRREPAEPGRMSSAISRL